MHFFLQNITVYLYLSLSLDFVIFLELLDHILAGTLSKISTIGKHLPHENLL